MIRGSYDEMYAPELLAGLQAKGGLGGRQGRAKV